MIKSVSSILIISSLLLFTACGSSSTGGGSTTPTNQNHAPTINTNFSHFSLLQNNGTTSYNIKINDIEGDGLNLNIESNDTTVLTVGKNFTNPLQQANYDAQSLSFNLTTAQDALGVVKITITVDDGDKNSTKSFDVSVTIFQSGDTWKGFEYYATTSPQTGEIWLDRNLGASRVCIDYNDTACFGDYYQWGRNADGHEKFDSNTTSQLVTSIDVNNSKFIKGSVYSDEDWTSADSNGSIRSANWLNIDGSSICPPGYKVPTDAELTAETRGINNRADAFNSFLKLPSAGYRHHFDGNLTDKNDISYLWSSSSFDELRSKYLYFNSIKIERQIILRTAGMPIRCIKD